MSDERVWNDEMGLLQIDNDTAERLLSGELSSDDAPPAYAGVARLIDAATGPTVPTELTSERSVVVVCLGAVRSATPLSPTGSRNPLKVTRLTSAKVVAGVLAFVFLATGTAAAATGVLPARAQAIVAHALSHVGISVPRPNPNSDVGSTNRGSSADSDSIFNRCSAFLANSNSVANSGNLGDDRNPSFASLIASHGGTLTSTTTFCKALVISHADHATLAPEGSGSSVPVLPGTTSNPSKQGNAGSKSTAASAQGRATNTSNPGNSGSHATPPSSPPGQSGATNPSSPGNSGTHGTSAAPGQNRDTTKPGNSGTRGTSGPPGQTRATNPSGPGNSGSHAAR